MNQLKAGLTHEDIYARFTEKFKHLATEIMGDVITEYLPHAESDLDSNVYHRAFDYIAGDFGADSMYGDKGRRFRQCIFEENKELIIKQLDQDNVLKIAELEIRLADLNQTFAEWRSRV